MTLLDYQQEWMKDGPLKLDKLDEDARNTPLLHARYWAYYTKEKIRFKKAEFAYRKLYRQRWEYFLNRMDDTEREALGWPIQPLKIIVAQVDKYLDGDDVLQAAKLTLTEAEETCRFLEDTLKNINNRGYLIGTTVNFLKFKMGQ